MRHSNIHMLMSPVTPFLVAISRPACVLMVIGIPWHRPEGEGEGARQSSQVV